MKWKDGFTSEKYKKYLEKMQADIPKHINDFFNRCTKDSMEEGYRTSNRTLEGIARKYVESEDIGGNPTRDSLKKEILSWPRKHYCVNDYDGVKHEEMNGYAEVLLKELDKLRYELQQIWDSK